MPFKPKRPCPGKGQRFNACPNLINSGEQCCAECLPFVKKANLEYDRERDQTEERQFIHSIQWRAIRKAKLARDPLCEQCLKFGYELGQERIPHDTPAVLVHHKDGNELNNVDENLESLCNSCHEEIEKGGRWGR